MAIWRWRSIKDIWSEVLQWMFNKVSSYIDTTEWKRITKDDIINAAVKYAENEATKKQQNEADLAKQTELNNQVKLKLNSLLPMADVSNEAVKNHVDNATKFIRDGKVSDRTNHILWAASDYLTKSSNSIWEWVSDKLQWIANLAAAPVSMVNDIFLAPATEPAIYWYKKLYNYIANMINNKKINEANELLDILAEMRKR